MLRSKTLRVQITPSQIVYLKFLLEGYDHLALPVVVDGKKAEIKLLIHPTELELLVNLIKEEFPSVNNFKGRQGRVFWLYLTHSFQRFLKRAYQ